MFRRTQRLAMLALALTLPLASCDSGTDTDFGTVSLLLTDANHSEITEAWVTFTDIYLQGSAGDADPESGRHYLLQDTFQEFELTSLAGEVADLVTGATVPAGSYGQLRVVLGDACVVTPDGVYSSSPDYGKCGQPTGVINLTSTSTSGWKVQLNGLVVQGAQEIILLDFVVDESFFRETAGPATLFTLNPVIKGADLSLSGGFVVSLSDPDGLLESHGVTQADFSVTMAPAEGDAQTVDFALDGESWLAAFQYEMPGQAYEFTLNAPSGVSVTVAPASPVTLELDSGETATVDWVITDASAS